MLTDLIKNLMDAQTRKDKERAYRNLEKIGMDAITANEVVKATRREKTVSNEVKTLAGWNEWAEEHTDGSFEHYCHPGDVVDREICEYFLDILPPHRNNAGYIQVGEPYDHRTDPRTNVWGATYMTFAADLNGVWRYCGNCFSDEEEDADNIAERVNRGKEKLCR